MTKTRKTTKRRKRRMRRANSQEARDELLDAALEQGGATQMNVGDWVFFKTRNWPDDVIRIESGRDSGELRNVSGQRPYQGRGKVVGVAGKNCTIREEKTDRLIEVGPNPDDEIRPLQFHCPTLTLGDLRAFLEKHKDAPDEIPVSVALPLSFFSDLDELPGDHPEYKAVSESYSVAASGIFFEAIHESGDSTDRYLPLEEREGENWDFSVEIVPHAEESFHAMRELGQ